MRAVEYRLIQDRNRKPLVMLDSPLGNGQEIYPEALRTLAAELLKIADEAEAREMGKGYRPTSKKHAILIKGKLSAQEKWEQGPTC